jgi:hypothetical protein
MKRLIAIVFVFICLKGLGQTFYVVAYDETVNSTYQLSLNNCDYTKLYTCPPTNANHPDGGYSYVDIAIDTAKNLYYISDNASLYTRELSDTMTCQFLGVFDSSIINSLVTDINGNVFAAGVNFNNIPALYEYKPKTKTFSTLGNLPIAFRSLGDLFFYEGNLFLTISDSDAALAEVNILDPSKSTFYMNLGDSSFYGAFTIQYDTYSDVYLLAPGTQNINSTLYKLNLSTKTLSGPICIYPFVITGAASIYSYTSLPLTLLSFTSTLINKTVQLQWQTTSEINSSYFLIERSSDGINFSTIGKVSAAGNSNSLKQYSFVDLSPLRVNYYRLKETDLDGKYTYSKIVTAKMQDENALNVIQDPVQDVLQLQINASSAQASHLTIFDLTGKRIKVFNSQNGVQNIDVSLLAAGTYFIQLITADGVVYNKAFVKI